VHERRRGAEGAQVKLAARNAASPSAELVNSDSCTFSPSCWKNFSSAATKNLAWPVTAGVDLQVHQRRWRRDLLAASRGQNGGPMASAAAILILLACDVIAILPASS